ncbi:MAG TPA: tRNA (adenosine(37)-N6)-dimethylallyltransferase MiaA [Treponemataceae bacterium]|nr:tRNA (adenosine(37)-N6)-dimethylallyltransferase MiaA [Treponemataceae bacterium]
MRRAAGPVRNCAVVLGPTATGKTAIGVAVARAVGGEILSADSRQVYRGLDVGSGKDLVEYGDVPYHLIDVADLSAEYSVFDYQRDFYRAFDEVLSRGRVPVVVGGTGMYLDAVLRSYDLREVPENPALRAELSALSLDELVARLIRLKKSVHNRTDLVDRERLVRAIEIAEATDAERDGWARPERPDIEPIVLGTRFPRDELRARILRRLDARLDPPAGEIGLVEEVAGLVSRGTSWERLDRLGLEYRFTADYLRGRYRDRAEYRLALARAIGQFAKRQETWFRRMERNGVGIEWLENAKREDALARILPLFKG